MNQSDWERELDRLCVGTPEYRGGVGRNSVLNYRRVIHSRLGNDGDKKLRQKITIIEKLRNRHRREHNRWLEGGVHPLGTQARTEADHTRHLTYTRRQKLETILLSKIIESLP